MCNLTLKMTSAQVVRMSVTTNSLSKDYHHPTDHTRQTTDTPGFKPCTCAMILYVLPGVWREERKRTGRC